MSTKRGKVQKPLSGVIRDDAPVRDYAVYGYHGGSLNITDGHYTYMRCPIDAHNGPLFEYTLMPTHMGSRFGPKEFEGVELAPPFSFTKDCKLLKTKPAEMSMNHYQFGNEPPRRRAAGYRRFLREIFVYAGEHIPRTPSRKRPKGRGIKPQKGYAL